MSGLTPASQPIQQEGASGFGVITTAGAFVTQIFSAASNVRGAYLRTAVLQPFSPNNIAIYGDTAAPASAHDTSKRCLLFSGAANVLVNLPFPIYLPPGTGLWIAGDAPSASTQIGFLTYDLVP